MEESDKIIQTIDSRIDGITSVQSPEIETILPNDNVIAEVEQEEERTITYPPLPPSRPESIDSSNGTDVQVPEEEVRTFTLRPMTDGLTVRLGLASRILTSLSQLGPARTRTLIFTTFLALAQIITYTIMLSLSSASRESCTQPLQLYLILSTIRIGINFPLSFYISLVPPRPSRRATELEREQLRNSRRIGSEATDRRIRRLSDLLSLGSLILFILGNFWLFTGASVCETSSPKLFYTTVGALVVSYLYAAEIVLIVIAVVFFLPLLLIVLRLFGVGEKTNEIGPLSNMEISKLPLRIYIPAPPSTTGLDAIEDTNILPSTSTSSSIPNSPSSPQSPTKSKSKSSGRFWRLFYKRIKSGSLPKSSPNGKGGEGSSGGGKNLNEYYKPPGSTFVTLVESQSTCAICLCDYDPPPKVSSPEIKLSTYEPEWLRLLPCSHAFHKGCLDSWLKVSGRCPLCQAPAVVKKGSRNVKVEGSGNGGGGNGGNGGDTAVVAIV